MVVILFMCYIQCRYYCYFLMGSKINVLLRHSCVGSCMSNIYHRGTRAGRPCSMAVQKAVGSVCQFSTLINTAYNLFCLLGFLYPVMHFRLDTFIFQCITALILYVYNISYMLQYNVTLFCVDIIVIFLWEPKLSIVTDDEIDAWDARM